MSVIGELISALFDGWVIRRGSRGGKEAMEAAAEQETPNEPEGETNR